MSLSNFETSASPARTSMFVHYYGEIFSAGVNIGEAHLHADGSIDLLVTSPPPALHATIYAVGQSAGNYIIVSDTPSVAGSNFLKVGRACRANQHIHLDLSSLGRIGTPCSLQLRVAS